jgi:hypothetical protein
MAEVSALQRTASSPRATRLVAGVAALALLVTPMVAGGAGAAPRPHTAGHSGWTGAGPFAVRGSDSR